jgi:hypothetical protein
VGYFALIQRLNSGRIVGLRHKEERTALGGLRTDMRDAWMFREYSEEQLPAEFLYVINGSAMKIGGLGIEVVPHEVISQLSPSILVELAA